MRLLQRYVLIDLLKVFAFALAALTIMLIFGGFVGEAVKSGLGPKQIVKILPYVVPSLLPLMIPATMLLTVCVVYGRMAGDSEITAIKASGINVMSVIIPSLIMGAVLSLGTFLLTDQFVPWAKRNIKRTISAAMEDIFLDILKANNRFSEDGQGIEITVREVRDRTLIKPTIRYPPRGGGDVITIQADEAQIRFDLENELVILDVLNCQIDTPGKATARIRGRDSIPVPFRPELTKLHPRDISIARIRRELSAMEDSRDAAENKRIIETVFSLSQGEFHQLDNTPFQPGAWEDVTAHRQSRKFRTELHSRVALASSCFFFVLLGAPYSIYFARSQFLTNFIVCFLPILTIYYPVILGMLNFSKSGSVHPALAMWVGNAGLFVAGIYMLRRVLRH